MKTLSETIKVSSKKFVWDSLNKSTGSSVRDFVQISVWGFVENTIWVSVCEQVSTFLKELMNENT